MACSFRPRGWSVFSLPRARAPAAALGSKGANDDYAVRVLDTDGRISERRVQIGLNDKVTAEVRSGLAENERVVTGELSIDTTKNAVPGPGGPPMGF